MQATRQQNVREDRILKPTDGQADRYAEEFCDHCGSKTTYPTSVNQGIVYTLIALLSAVKNKARAGNAKPNDIHLRNEIGISNEEAGKMGGIHNVAYNGRMTHTMIDNIRHVTVHGLARPVEKGSGRFYVTAKGARFLRGGYAIPRTAIVDSVKHISKGYWEPDGYITLEEVMKFDPKGLAPFWWHDEYKKISDRVIGDEEQPGLF